MAGHMAVFSVSTNGTFFDEDIFRKFKDLQFAVQVSCDGDEATTMEHRKGNWAKVIENIKENARGVSGLGAYG